MPKTLRSGVNARLRADDYLADAAMPGLRVEANEQDAAPSPR